jgi:nitronate monooxygenase
VTRYRKGDEVYGTTGGVGGHQGSLAEFAAVDADLLALKPANLSMREAAALPPVFITAWEGLVDRAAVGAGCKVLVHGGGVDAIIAQGVEAGGHRGMFLTTEPASQLGTLVLVPQVVDAVRVPVIAAGGIADGRAIAAAFALGASAVQMGTAYLLCPEAIVSPHLRAALKAKDYFTAVTNVVSGRPARVVVNRIVREVGPIATGVPSFPLGGAALEPLRTMAEARGSPDFTGIYAGQAAALSEELPASELTMKLAADALERLHALARHT